MSGQIRISVEYPHAVGRVWRAITDTQALEQWLMPNDFQPVVGHRFTFRSHPQPGWDGVVNGEVLHVDEPRRLSFTWRGGPLDTVVTFELTAIEGGTRLCMTHAGFDGIKANLVRLILKSGWGGMYRERLPAVLDRMSEDGTLRGVTEIPACARRGRWKLLATLLAPILNRKGGARGVIHSPVNYVHHSRSIEERED